MLPWLRTNASWSLAHPTASIFYDPSLDTDEQADIDQDPIRVLRALLGGRLLPGAVPWPARIEPVTALLGRFNSYTGRPTLPIDAVDGALIRALRGQWHFPTVNGKSRDLPRKPNHPFEDLGDAFCYFVGGLAPSRDRSQQQRPKARSKIGFDPFDHADSTRRR